jgi:hypothetical protein
MGKKRPNWNEWKHLLGTMHDKELAKKMNVHHSTVWSQRKRRGIPSYLESIDWANQAWGEKSDEAIAEELRVSVSRAMKNRQKLGIPPYKPAPAEVEEVAAEPIREEITITTLHQQIQVLKDQVSALLDPGGVQIDEDEKVPTPEENAPEEDLIPLNKFIASLRKKGLVNNRTEFLEWARNNDILGRDAHMKHLPTEDTYKVYQYFRLDIVGKNNNSGIAYYSVELLVTARGQAFIEQGLKFGLSAKALY